MLSEHIVAQESMATSSIHLKKPDFRMRELKQSQVEVDFILPSAQPALLPGQQGTGVSVSDW